MTDTGAAITIGGFAALAVLVIAAAAVHDCNAEDRFMAECQADGHKRYECEAMHRAGDSHVVPMPIIIHH